MMLLDTSVAIAIWDGDPAMRLRQLPVAPVLSIFTRIELEGGVHANAALAGLRRQRLDAILRALTVLSFDTSVVDAYGRIVASLGFSRRTIMDRLIAATAIVHDLTLITTNADDFAHIPDLRLEVWPAQ